MRELDGTGSREPGRAAVTSSGAFVTVSRGYTCQCGRPVYLRNTLCLACGTELGYVPELTALLPLAPAQEHGTYTIWTEPQGRKYRRCTNFYTIGCNWLVPVYQDGEFRDPSLAEGLCISCSCTRTIPDLSEPGHLNAWRLLEEAKRRVLSQVLALGLPVTSRLAQPFNGLAFDMLANQLGRPRVLTGHADGVITLNIEEADDAKREAIRHAMQEPYRTLVGHFRHEIGHYYWNVLIQSSSWLAGFRELFGDERVDYANSLQRYYSEGPAEGWSTRYVTNYASAHPWEDWAETWAHYLHMVDAVDTAMSFGMNVGRADLSVDEFTRLNLRHPDWPEAASFLAFLNHWVKLTSVVNELSRSMGLSDFYPFVLPHAAVSKLHFIHEVITAKRLGIAAPPMSPPLAQTDGSTIQG